ncbi:DUF6950 family protein [Chelativorans sp. YIM 93263]|uniref:DUF6950 family protein n=1 Tax=Chelativorans sp. YIM 93263 TaxID=2906648 RepID=UPI002378E460|nr:hypothetical protein [Chelativorans sp. YIM 93263]
MIAMQRVPGWRLRFDAVIDEIKYSSFAWGERDCGPWLVGRVVEAVTGEDLAAPYRGRYRTYRGAVRVMREQGYHNLGDLVASMLPEIHPSQAKIADIAAFADDTELGFSLGPVNGDRVFVMQKDHLGTMGLLKAKRAFKVG